MSQRQDGHGRRLGLVVALLTFAALIFTPVSAFAGTYEIRSCDETDNAIEVWKKPDADPGFIAQQNCPSGLKLESKYEARTVAYDQDSWLVATALEGTKFTRVRFVGRVDVTDGWKGGVIDLDSNRWIGCETCGASASRWVTVPFETQRVGLKVRCEKQGGCDLQTGHGWLNAREIVLTAEDPWPPNILRVEGPVTYDRWLRGAPQLSSLAMDTVGIRRVVTTVAGKVTSKTELVCTMNRIRPCLPSVTVEPEVDLRDVSDGTKELAILVTNGAENVRRYTRKIRVDQNPPAALENLQATVGWRKENRFVATWNQPAVEPDRAPVTEGRYMFCPGPASSSLAKCGAPNYAPVGKGNRLEDIAVPASGIWTLRVWGVDAAGNEERVNSAATTVYFDDQAPTVGLSPMNARDPLRVEATAGDGHSGVAEREITIQRHGDANAQTLPLQQNGADFSARIDDERLAQGDYTIRAHVVDKAGNEASATRQISLPMRLRSKLTVGTLKKVRVGKKRRTCVITKPRVRYGRTLTLRGRLTGQGSTPLANREVIVTDRPGRRETVGTVRTDEAGTFEYRAPAGTSRTIKFRYAGDSEIRGQTALVTIDVKAASTIRASRSRAVNGDSVSFTGRIFSQPVPSKGKLLKLQVRSRGRWLTFATPRTNRNGRWRHSYRFTATRGVTKYTFRVSIPSEAGFPYSPGVSQKVSVRVVGL